MTRGGNTRFQRKLTDDHVDFLLERVAEFSSHEQAAVLLEREHGVKVDKSTVTRLAQKEVKRIKEKREAYLSSFDTTPLAHTKLRVLELQRLFKEARDNQTKLATGEMVSLRLSIADQMELQTRMLDSIRQEMNPIQHALIIGAGAKEAEDFLQALGFGRADPGRVPKATRPDNSH